MSFFNLILVLIKISVCKVANSADPDQKPHYVASDMCMCLDYVLPMLNVLKIGH